MSEPLSKPVDTSVFVDADLDGNVVIHRLHTVMITFVNNAPIMVMGKYSGIWYQLVGDNNSETFEELDYGMKDKTGNVSSPQLTSFMTTFIQ